MEENNSGRFSPKSLLSLFLMSFQSVEAIDCGVIGDEVDVKQRSRKNNGNLFHTTECFSRGWKT